MRIICLACAALLAGCAQPDRFPVRFLQPDGATGASAAVVVPDSAMAYTAQFTAADQFGDVEAKGDVPAQVGLILDRMKKALAEVGSGLDRLVKLHVVTANDQVADQVRAGLSKGALGGAWPATTFVSGDLPYMDALVAMDGVAVAPPSSATGVVYRVRSKLLDAQSVTAHVSVLPKGAEYYVSGQAEGGNIMDATHKTMQGLHKTLTHLGLGSIDVVQLKVFLSPITEKKRVEQEIASFYEGQVEPPIVFVEWNPGGMPIEIELVAWAGEAKPVEGDTVRYITPPGMKASPTYSRVAKVAPGPVIYVAGQHGEPGRSGEKQIRSIFAKMEALLKEAGGDMRHLAKATYYVTDDDASGQLNKIRPEVYDPKRPPAASKAGVKGAGKKGTTVTIDMIAAPSP